MMAYAVHLCGTYSIPSEAPGLHDRIHAVYDIQYTQVGLLKYSMASSVRLMANDLCGYVWIDIPVLTLSPPRGYINIHRHRFEKVFFCTY